jgi:hypothetical protein
MTYLLQGYRQFRAHALDSFKRHASYDVSHVMGMHKPALTMT